MRTSPNPNLNPSTRKGQGKSVAWKDLATLFEANWDEAMKWINGNMGPGGRKLWNELAEWFLPRFGVCDKNMHYAAYRQFQSNVQT